LPPGDYVVAYSLGGANNEMPFSVAASELVEIPVVLNAGVIAVTVPGDNYVEIFGAAKSIDGARKSFDYGYGPELQTTLPAGEYVVSVNFDDTKSETPVTIVAGERFELTVEAATDGKSK